jgi:hypothetical protein
VSIEAPAACIHHPDREAMGVCVRCRARHCSECITKVDGVNFCARCLAELAADGASSTGARSPRAIGRLGSVLRAALYFVVLWALAWAMIEAAFPDRFAASDSSGERRWREVA